MSFILGGVSAFSLSFRGQCSTLKSKRIAAPEQEEHQAPYTPGMSHQVKLLRQSIGSRLQHAFSLVSSGCLGRRGHMWCFNVVGGERTPPRCDLPCR